ncbi:MAG TPA: hypothetical protein VMU14_19175 [Acidimicrobiales bacterium]|nr:hypothetical protein [Acidimicrobiales bacterium]
MVAMTQVQALVLLFVVLPFVVAGGVIAFINWRSSSAPPPVRTSTILATGEAGDAVVLGIRSFGGLFDTRPMIRLDLRVTTAGAGPFDLQVTQSLPRPFARALKVGDRVEVRVLPDHTAGAIVPSTTDEG